ncbi:uncharacterized protein LOC106172616 [Lingula anatina]|uniref:Uncharacterized protein LOC106172616 n=1 Tax=Lingula anatina TaxID=7574 RepID=A0A1S3JEL9_LINAN|nr:uncharacterized protein LOC106172616 [Lingula anatina]|eukprot:XP_013408857.1 uncharacterized protein LOC106172616 [Lingula anatina]
MVFRNTVLQMDVKPSNILLDQNWNARLRLHGPAAEVTSVDHSDQIYQDPDFLSSQGKYRKEYDVFSVGVVMLKLLGAEEEFLKEFRTEDGKFQVQVEGVTKKFSSSKLFVFLVNDNLFFAQEILDVGDKIDTFIKPSGKLCCKCNLNNAAEDLHPRVKCSKPRKREKCAIFCQDCLTDHYRNPLYCPTHGFTQPPIGHDASFALLVGGFDEENPEIFQNDVLEFKRVLINHNIMGFRESQVYMVLCDRKKKKKATCKQKIEDRISEIKKKTAEHPEATFVFFYSGHGTKEGLNLQGDGSFQITKRELQKMFEHLNVSEKLIILDCCFAASNKMFHK